MSDLTTAQRLAAYRDELVAAGFAHREVWELVESAAPTLSEDLRVRADERSDVLAAAVNTFSASRRPKTEEAAVAALIAMGDQFKEADRVNAQRDVRLTKRSMWVEGDGIRIEDEFSDGKCYVWSDLCNRVEVDFPGDGSMGWTTSCVDLNADV